MPRTQIAFGDRMLRLFNGRGAVSIRDKSLTGLQTLQFPPIDIRDYRFFLAFRETKANVLIQDVVPDVYDYMVETGKGPHPLGLNFTPGTPFVMLLQQAYWEPNAFFRTGTFHKQFGDRWISFAISTKTNVSADKDEIYMTVEIENREADPLEFVASPDQRRSGFGAFVSQSTQQARGARHPPRRVHSGERPDPDHRGQRPSRTRERRMAMGDSRPFQAEGILRHRSSTSFGAGAQRGGARPRPTDGTGRPGAARPLCNGRVKRCRKSAPATRPLMTSIAAAF